MVSTIHYELRGVPLEVSERMNAQTSMFRQLEVRSDLSNCRVLPGQYFVFTQRLGSALSLLIHVVTIMRSERTIKYFRSLPVLTTA